MLFTNIFLIKLVIVLKAHKPIAYITKLNYFTLAMYITKYIALFTLKKIYLNGLFVKEISTIRIF